MMVIYTIATAVEKTVKNNYDFLDNKSKAENHYQVCKEKLQKRSRKCYRNFSEDEKTEKGNYVNNRNKNMMEVYRQRRK